MLLRVNKSSARSPGFKKQQFSSVFLLCSYIHLCKFESGVDVPLLSAKFLPFAVQYPTSLSIKSLQKPETNWQYPIHWTRKGTSKALQELEGRLEIDILERRVALSKLCKSERFDCLPQVETKTQQSTHHEPLKTIQNSKS